MLGVIKGTENLKWQLEFLWTAHPDAMENALHVVGMCRVEDVFSSDTSTLVEFLDNVCGELPYRTDPVVRIVAEQIRTLANEIKDEVNTAADFDMITKAWLTTRDNEVLLFQLVDAQKISISVAATESIAERLAANGPLRHFGFDSGTLGRLEQLKAKTPNFVEVIDCIQDAVSLATRYNRPIRVIPILMVGEPGIGKSYFTDQLSQIMGIPLTRIAIDNLQIGSDIAGMSYAYSKSSPGSVFRVLTENDHASPLVILDELDKAPLNWGYGDPLGPLHNLLEPVSAKVFKDASFPVSIDASNVIWIATANELARIPITIRSRFEVFKVDVPSADQFDAILGEICQEFRLKYPKVSFDEGIVDVLRGMTPREQRKILDRAVARASRAGEDRVTARHVREVLGHEEPRPKLGIVKEPTGYL